VHLFILVGDIYVISLLHIFFCLYSGQLLVYNSATSPWHQCAEIDWRESNFATVLPSVFTA